MGNVGGGVPFVGAAISTAELGVEGQKAPGIFDPGGKGFDILQEIRLATVKKQLEENPDDPELLALLESLEPGPTSFTPEQVFQAFSDALDFGVAQSGGIDGLLERLSGLLIDPARVPGDPCLAPAPLLRDLLDLALGKVGSTVDGLFGTVSATVEDFILPAFSNARVLAESVQKVLEDPITAALNLILGQRGKIDCVATGALGVGTGVIETQLKRLEDALAEALP